MVQRMNIKRGEETISLARRDGAWMYLGDWTDENGKSWSNPTLEFMQLRGFEVVPQPPPILADQQTQAWLNIKAERDQRKNGGVFVSGKWFHTDTESRIQWLGLVIMGASVPPIQWKTMDGTFITISQSLVGTVFQAIAAGDSADFANAETHRAAMMLSATPETYDYSTGWRTVYGG